MIKEEKRLGSRYIRYVELRGMKGTERGRKEIKGEGRRKGRKKVEAAHNLEDGESEEEEE